MNTLSLLANVVAVEFLMLLPVTAETLPDCPDSKSAAWDNCWGTWHYVTTDGKEWTYTGEWQNDQKSGFGVAKWADGRINYEGQFKNNYFDGFGTQYYYNSPNNGDIYVGDFFEGKRHGYGTYTFANGDTYEGYFQSNKRTGWGIMHFSDGARYEGDFIEGKFDGFGTYYYWHGTVYVGEWSDGTREGEGEITFNDGTFYKGYFSEGKATSSGKATLADGSVAIDPACVTRDRLKCQWLSCDEQRAMGMTADPDEYDMCGLGDGSYSSNDDYQDSSSTGGGCDAPGAFSEDYDGMAPSWSGYCHIKNGSKSDCDQLSGTFFKDMGAGYNVCHYLP